MRFLSLSRPWPWAIFDMPEPLAKRCENRSWFPSQLGRIALHAAKSKDENAFSFFISLGIDDCPGRWDLHPEGVIVGVATIVGIADKPEDLAEDQRRWFFTERADKKKNYGWILDDVVKLATPIAFRGAQGLRELPPLENAQVTKQLRAA